VAFGDEIGELVETAGDKIDELHLADGAQAEIAHSQAAPMMALSLMGVSITRSQPKRSRRPSLV